jgi:glycosyltransferase involved in cell wall biosynthesis
MAAGVPVVASDFPMWREIVNKHECGICVDPGNVREIAGAIRWILEHPETGAAMGDNGRRAVFQNYSWEGEARKLEALYLDVIT